MPSERFFDEQSEQSEVKTRIIEKYFYVWAKVIMPTAERQGGRIAYIDLYAGPGRYKDGAESTPLLILRHAINDPKMSKMLDALFNDSDPINATKLQSEIDALPGIENLKNKPRVICGKVNDSAAEYFNNTRLNPSFSFLDPFGYKGLSRKIVNGLIKDWGCDCVFFFNFNRVNPGIPNSSVDTHMEALFGPDRINVLRSELPDLKPETREARIVEELCQAIKEVGGKFVLPFRFRNSLGTRTLHYLIFVSKSFKGFEIMKDIMAKESSTQDQGVPSFSYSPADASMPFLFSFNQPLENLKLTLPSEYSGQELTVDEIYKQHSVDKPYVRKNYKDILMQLEEEGKIELRSLTGKRRKGTFADHLLVRFQ
ncbi:MAG: three-Cys-motif partner protein TcmP [Alphaproteobacteria bacterium]|nr:three-Cys-motif partner protein TcmP [Alphaproteobacteria bacterium]